MTELEASELTKFVLYLADWQLFCTATFTRRRGLFETGKAYEQFMDRNFPQITHFYGVEENPSGDGGHHVHSMWADADDIRRRLAWRKAFAQMGRTRIEPIRDQGKVRDYCTKYVVKEGALWWFRINNSELWNQRRRMPTLVA